MLALAGALTAEANTACPANPPAIADVDSFSQTVFDYIIIGELLHPVICPQR